jgi:hypothetical protein
MQKSAIGNGRPPDVPVVNDEKHKPPERTRSVVIKQARNHLGLNAEIS